MSRLLVTIIGLIVTLVLAACGGSGATQARQVSSDKAKRLAPPATKKAFSVHVLPSTVRYGSWVDVKRYPKIISLDMARGEAEGAQLVVDSGSRHTEFTFRPGDLRGAGGATLGSDHVDVYLQHSMKVSAASPKSKAGVYFDPLQPVKGKSLRIRQQGRMALWIDVKAGVAQQPGRYAGSIEVLSAGSVIYRVPLKVRVRRVTLPKRPFLHSAVGLSLTEISAREGVSQADSRYATLIGKYYSLLARSRLSPSDTHGGGNMAVLESIYDQDGISTFHVPIWRTSPYGDALGADRVRTREFLANMKAEFVRRGWFKDSHVFIFDEPSPDNFDDLRDWASLIHEAGFRLMVPLTINPAIDDVVDIWSVNISHRINRADIADQHRRGREYWWYLSISSHPPYPTVFIDDRRASTRAIGWLAYRYRIDGMTYWTVTRWNEVSDPWVDPKTYTQTDGVGNGDGSMMYPGKTVGHTGPAPSVRLMMMRDGIEDNDLMMMAAKRHGFRKVDAVAKTLAPELTNFTSSGSKVKKARGQLFRMLGG